MQGVSETVVSEAVVSETVASESVNIADAEANAPWNLEDNDEKSAEMEISDAEAAAPWNKGASSAIEVKAPWNKGKSPQQSTSIKAPAVVASKPAGKEPKKADSRSLKHEPGPKKPPANTKDVADLLANFVKTLQGSAEDKDVKMKQPPWEKDSKKSAKDAPPWEKDPKKSVKDAPPWEKDSKKSVKDAPPWEKDSKKSARDARPREKDSRTGKDTQVERAPWMKHKTGNSFISLLSIIG